MKRKSFSKQTLSSSPQALKKGLRLSQPAQVQVSLLLENNKRIQFQLPKSCSLEKLNAQLTAKALQHTDREFVGFQSDPPNPLFDYRLHLKMGDLTKSDITLQCVYKMTQEPTGVRPSQLQKQQVDLHSGYRIKKYKLCKALSSGGFSRVYLVRCLVTGQFYAAKFMEKRSNANKERVEAIRNEFLIQKAICHPYIVKMHEYIETEGFFVLIMEYCPGGELFNLLKKNRSMGEANARCLFIQTVLAIDYLHASNIIFRDIKPENILIDSKGQAKLTDFGLAKVMRKKTNSYCGSVEYMAPEVVMKMPYSWGVDLYCLGALLYEILVGCPPFYSPDFCSDQTKYHICHSEVAFPSRVNLSSQVKDLISKLLRKNPKHRLPNTQSILEHPWFSPISIQSYRSGNPYCPFVPDLQIQNFERHQDAAQFQFTRKVKQELQQYAQSLHPYRQLKKPIPQVSNSKKTLYSQSKSRSKSLNVFQANSLDNHYSKLENPINALSISQKKKSAQLSKNNKSLSGFKKSQKSSPYDSVNFAKKRSVFQRFNHNKYYQAKKSVQSSNNLLAYMKRGKEKVRNNINIQIPQHHKSLSSHISVHRGTDKDLNKNQLQINKNNDQKKNERKQKGKINSSSSVNVLSFLKSEQKENWGKGKVASGSTALKVNRSVNRSLKKQKPKGHHRYMFSQLPLDCVSHTPILKPSDQPARASILSPARRSIL